MPRILLATLHLRTLGIGIGAILGRSITFRRPLTRDVARGYGVIAR